MADKTDSLTPSQPGEMNLTANHANRKSGQKRCANGYRDPKPTPPPKPPHLRNIHRNGESPRMAVRPRSSVFPMNWDRSSMDALTDSQMQQVISTLLNGVLMNSHLSVDPSLKELLMNAGIAITTTVSSSSLPILKVTISTTADILKRLSDWETDLTTAVRNAEFPLRSWTILTATTVVNIQSTAATDGDPLETALVDIFCNRSFDMGGDAVHAINKALLGPDDKDDTCIFSRAHVPTENVNVTVTYSN